MFFVVEREENRQKNMITGISGFGFFFSKNDRFVTHNCFSKIGVLKPLFYSVLGGCAFSGPSCQIKGIFGHPPKNKKFLTDN